MAYLCHGLEPVAKSGKNLEGLVKYPPKHRDAQILITTKRSPIDRLAARNFDNPY